MRHGLPLRGERGRASRVRPADARSRAEHDRHLRRAGGDARRRRHRIAFASTGSVYGEPEVFPTPETCPFPVQTSLYGASKLAGEGLIQAYAHGYGFVGVDLSLRLDPRRALHARPRLRLLSKPARGSVAPARARRRSTGEVVPLRRRLRLGDDARDGTVSSRPGAIAVYNLGTDETIVVDDSIATITAQLGVTPELEYTGGIRGWLGDSPLIHLDCERIRSLGWRPTLSIRDAIRRTVDWLEQNPSVLDERAAA